MKNSVDIKSRIKQHKKEIERIGGRDWSEVHIYRRLIEELRWILSEGV